MIMYIVCFDQPINTNNPARYVHEKFNAMQMQENEVKEKGTNDFQSMTLKLKRDTNASMRVYMLMKMQSMLIRMRPCEQEVGYLPSGWAGRPGASLGGGNA